MYELSKFAIKYNVMILVSWFALPLRALELFILSFDKYNDTLDFVIVAIIISIANVTDKELHITYV